MAASFQGTAFILDGAGFVTLVTKNMEEKLVLAVSAYPETEICASRLARVY